MEGKAIEDWERPLRKGVKTRLNVERIMASAALPLLFSSPSASATIGMTVGGIRLVTLSPAVHLGADRLLVISTRCEFPPYCKLRKKAEGPPSRPLCWRRCSTPSSSTSSITTPCKWAGINNLLRELSQPQDRRGLREIETVVIRPSADLGTLANEFEAKLPGTFRYFMRRFGYQEAEEQDLISTVMFRKGVHRGAVPGRA